MNKLTLVLAALAVPAAAQDSAAWTVGMKGGTCTAEQPAADSGSGHLSVAYDAAREEVVLTSADPVASPLPATGAIDLAVVLVDNGPAKLDDQWAVRHFTYVRQGSDVLFTTRFAGKENVSQILTDLAASRRIGFLQHGEPIIDHPLAGLAPAIAELKACAAKGRA